MHPIKGRCVHAARDFKKGELIETNPVIVYGPLPEDHELQSWSMWWTEKEDAIALGNLNLLNHSTTPNVSLSDDHVKMTKTIYAKREISKGEELTLDYGCDLWFDVVE